MLCEREMCLGQQPVQMQMGLCSKLFRFFKVPDFEKVTTEELRDFLTQVTKDEKDLKICYSFPYP